MLYYIPAIQQLGEHAYSVTVLSYNHNGNRYKETIHEHQTFHVSLSASALRKKSVLQVKIPPITRDGTYAPKSAFQKYGAPTDHPNTPIPIVYLANLSPYTSGNVCRPRAASPS